MPKLKKEKLHLAEKRYELMWALSLQGYNGEEIGIIMGFNRSTVKRVLDKMPKGYTAKWVKRSVAPVQ